MRFAPMPVTPRFGGLLFKATVTADSKPHFTAYFGDYKQINPAYKDGVVLMQPVNTQEPPLVLEENNAMVGDCTRALVDQGHLKINEDKPWPWPDDLRLLFTEVFQRLTHPSGWMKGFSDNKRDESEPFNRIFNGVRPFNRGLTFEELVYETVGYRVGRVSGEVESSRRRPLLDHDFAGLLGHKLWRVAQMPHLSPPPAPPEDIVAGTEKKRFTLPVPIGDWLKDPGNQGVVAWLMGQDHAKLVRWLQVPENLELLRTLQQLAPPRPSAGKPSGS